MRLRLLLLLAVGCLAVRLAHGGAPATPPVPGTIQPGAGVVPPPAPPIPVSPVNIFRELLAMTATERESALAARPEKQREILRLRLADYERFNPIEREERLNATDLYWHLQQLLRRAPSERAELLGHVPASLRVVLAQRLALWDHLPAAEQQALLQHERTVRYLSRLRQVQMPPLPGTNAISPARASATFETEVARLGNLTPSEFQRLHQQWRQFFEAPAPRTDRALRTMSDEERTEMTVVLERFRKLSPDQRRTCVDSFTRLASLSAPDRALFLRSAERWESLSADERATWRQLVTKLPIFPPLPTDHAEPPLPPTAPKRALLSGGAGK